MTWSSESAFAVRSRSLAGPHGLHKLLSYLATGTLLCKLEKRYYDQRIIILKKNYINSMWVKQLLYFVAKYITIFIWIEWFNFELDSFPWFPHHLKFQNNSPTTKISSNRRYQIDWNDRIFTWKVYLVSFSFFTLPDSAIPSTQDDFRRWEMCDGRPNLSHKRCFFHGKW